MLSPAEEALAEEGRRRFAASMQEMEKKSKCADRKTTVAFAILVLLGVAVGFVIWASGRDASATTKSLGWMFAVFAVLGAIAAGGFGWTCS